ncbi:TonB-dependent siderophore receptor [Dyella nitratireducens]|uniref:Ligand-gated channel n=1 Tax=Dyella nitratireducens TaxID=1849580 RepID=A0ABQ1FQK9_9GAMM|nr:TonB-dependent receptor [Dyella nitratireducens]GGA25591.1 ligand-gated channel [Dyella nitratireducens]GLQ43665.1 ligand-gated channel [Dyella nitratireducens]
MRFEIPAQSLATALIAFGKQANVQVLTAGKTVDALRSHEVIGSLTPEAALARLLDGTNMRFDFVDARTVVVKPRADASVQPSKRPSADESTTVLLPPIQAIGLVGRDAGFMADVTSGPGRMLADPLDVPESVSVVTQSLLQSEQVLTIADAIRNVAGAQYVDGTSGLPVFDVRGFIAGNGMTDGMPNNVLGIGDYPPMIALERVEVLKGPQAVLGDTSAYNNFGGLIDVVLKKPQSDPVRHLSWSIGEHGEKQLGLDLAGPLNASKSLTYRLVLNGDVADRTPQGMRGQRNRYVAPSVGWSTPDTTFIAGMSWMMNHVPIPDHVVLLGDTVQSASPPGILLDNPNDHSSVETRRLFYLLEHRFNDTWTFRSRAQYVRETMDLQNWQVSGMDFSGDVGAVGQQYRASDAYYTLQNDLVAAFGHGWMQHTAMLGVDYSRIQIGSGLDAFSNGGAGIAYNIFTSGPLQTPASQLSSSDYLNGYIPGTPWTTESGVFLQDQINFGSQFEVLLAVRRTSYQLDTTHADGTPWNLHKVHWVPNFGLVYKLTPDMSLYANTSNGFQPDVDLGKNNAPLPPSLSRQLEAGAKFDLFQHRARLTVAAYRIMLDHSNDLISLQPPYYIVSGPGQSNQGIEIEFNGQLAPGLNLSTAYTRASVHNNDGSAATGQSQQRFNLWTSYAFQHGWLRGFGMAGGVLARSRSIGEMSDDSAYIQISGQARVDMNVFYRAQRWSVTLGVRNVLARNLYSPTFNETFVPLDDHRTFLFSGAVDF